eukprot:GEMP01019509.1.p1 GENE.GEMP01019509.1~~GEMP01019509.1.p1  ORF type:complete len:489 (+),score=132.14 GEMP01019509.1:245-1711(+)
MAEKPKKEKKEKKRRKHASDSEQEQGRTQSASSCGVPATSSTAAAPAEFGGLPGGFPMNHHVPAMIGYMQQQAMIQHMMLQQQMMLGQEMQSNTESTEKDKEKDKEKEREKVKAEKGKKKKKKRKRESSSSESRSNSPRTPRPRIVRRTNFSEAPPPPPGPPPPLGNDAAVEKERRMQALLASQEAEQKNNVPQIAGGIAPFLVSNNIALHDVWLHLKRLTVEQQVALMSQGSVVRFNQPTQVLVQRIQQIEQQAKVERFTPKVDLIGPSLEEQLKDLNDRDDFEAQMALKDARHEKKQLAIQNSYERAAITGQAMPLGRQLSITELLELEDMARAQLEADGGALAPPMPYAALQDAPSPPPPPPPPPRCGPPQLNHHFQSPMLGGHVPMGHGQPIPAMQPMGHVRLIGMSLMGPPRPVFRPTRPVSNCIPLPGAHLSRPPHEAGVPSPLLCHFPNGQDTVAPPSASPSSYPVPGAEYAMYAGQSGTF